MTILFIISMCALGVMLCSKVFEMKVRKIDFLSEMFAKGDAKIHSSIDMAVFKYNRYKNIAHIFAFDFMPSFTYEMLVKTKDYVSKKYYQSADDFRGRRILKNTGSVSFFLERLSEDKSGMRNN